MQLVSTNIRKDRDNLVDTVHSFINEALPKLGCTKMIFIYIMVFCFLGIFVFFGGKWIPDQEISSSLHDLALTFFGTMLGMGIAGILAHKNRIWVCFLATTIYRYRHIRISAAYIFKIYVDGRYLLIKGRNVDQFQPVGGVYKRLPDSTSFFQKIDILDDNKIPLTETTKLDLRVRVKGAVLHKFLSWYNNNQDREISHWREFCEELILPGIVKGSIFPHINYKFLHRNPLYIHHSSFYNCPEILIHEVYELIPSEVQLSELKRLIYEESRSSTYKWVSEDVVKRLGYLPDNSKPFTIAEHTNTLIDKHFKIK